MSTPRLVAVAFGVGLLVAAAAVAFGLLAPPVTVESSVQPGVTIECSAASGSDAETCRAWGDEVIAAGPPSFTFEMEDLERLLLDRSLLGFGSTCGAAYVISRSEDPAWEAEIACPPR